MLWIQSFAHWPGKVHASLYHDRFVNVSCIYICMCMVLFHFGVQTVLFIAGAQFWLSCRLTSCCVLPLVLALTPAWKHSHSLPLGLNFTHILSMNAMAQERLSGILHDMSNLDDIANSHDWATAAAPREPKCTGTYWIKCTSDSCFLHCKSTAAHVQLQWQPGMQVPCIKYNKMGFYELHEASHVHRCAHIMQVLQPLQSH